MNDSNPPIDPEMPEEHDDPPEPLPDVHQLPPEAENLVESDLPEAPPTPTEPSDSIEAQRDALMSQRNEVAQKIKQNLSRKKAKEEIQKLIKEDKTVSKEDALHTLSFVEDLPLPLYVEVARTKMSLREVLAWKKGAVVNFDKVVGELLEIFLGDNLLARGEVVVVNDHYGIRITEITRSDEKV